MINALCRQLARFTLTAESLWLDGENSIIINDHLTLRNKSTKSIKIKSMAKTETEKQDVRVRVYYEF